MDQDTDFAGQIIEAKKIDPDCDPSAASFCLLFGIIALFTWMVPAIGMAAPLAGLACGRRGWRAPNCHRAHWGVGMCVISLALESLIFWLAFVMIELSKF